MANIRLTAHIRETGETLDTTVYVPDKDLKWANDNGQTERLAQSLTKDWIEELIETDWEIEEDGNE